MSDPAAAPQYDAFATAYDVVWTVPAVRPMLPLLTSTLASLGPFTGARALDLASGTGIGLRLMRTLGATHLVGVDISPQMLEVAKATTPDITAHTADCTKPLDHLGLEPGSFDIVLGMWLLNYTKDSNELRGMWANVARYLKPGGKFVGIIENHDVVHPECVRDLKYGAKESSVTELSNGEGWSVHLYFATEPVIEFDAFRMRGEVLERVAREEGMGELKYSRPGWEEIRQVQAEGIGGEAGKDDEWWKPLVDEAPNLVVVAEKQ